MDVSLPITTVVPSLDGPVLAALAATTTPMGLATVHARAGRGSKSGIRTVLLRMVEEGLVLDVPGGYVLNRDHLAAPAIESLASLHGELVDRIRQAVEEWPVPPTLVGLFGSAARRDGDSHSDIDVLVVSEDPELAERVDALAVQIQRWTGNGAHVVGRTPAEVARLRRADEPILAEWTRDLVVLAGTRSALGKMTPWLGRPREPRDATAVTR
jgi:predicted nucleotidyltransferase